MCDLTITRLGRRPLLGRHRRRGRQARPRLDAPHLPADGSRRAPTTAPPGSCCIGVWGPRARELVAVADRGRPVGRGVPVHDARATPHRLRAGHARCGISYVGELGWEIYAPTEFGAQLWDTLWGAGEPLGAVACGGARLRLAAAREGLPALGPGHRRGARPVRGRPRLGGALDKDATSSAASRGASARSAASSASCAAWSPTTRRVVLVGKEPILDGDAGARVRDERGYGCTVGESILYGYLPVSHAEVGTRLSVWSEGAAQPVTVSRRAAVRPRERAA